MTKIENWQALGLSVLGVPDNDRSRPIPWLSEFEPFRHCTTHESLIRHDDIVYRFDPVTRRYKLSRRIKLPDNPQVRPFTYNRNRLINEYVASTFKRINRLVSEIYRNALRDIRAGGNVLPVPAP